VDLRRKRSKGKSFSGGLFS